jgi:hypothetical protein
MSAPWIDGGEIGVSLQEQARNIAIGLGHRMTSWLAKPGERTTYMARCVDCEEAATIAVRHFSRSPISGVAVQLRCRPKKRR